MLGEGNQVQSREGGFVVGRSLHSVGRGSRIAVRCQRSCRRGRSQRLATPKLVPSRGYLVRLRTSPPPSGLNLNGRPQFKTLLQHSDPRLGASIGLIRSGDFTAVNSSPTRAGRQGASPHQDGSPLALQQHIHTPPMRGRHREIGKILDSMITVIWR